MGDIGNSWQQYQMQVEWGYWDQKPGEIRKVKALTNKPFAVNYIFPMGEASEDPFTNAVFDVLAKENVKNVIAIGQNVVERELKRLKEHDIKVLYRDLSPTVLTH
ncbi:hypothetical protein D3C76_21290 [compost metagenome]